MDPEVTLSRSDGAKTEPFGSGRPERSRRWQDTVLTPTGCQGLISGYSNRRSSGARPTFWSQWRLDHGRSGGRSMQRKALLAISLLLAGCSSMGNTPAQDLAYERMKKCEHVGASMVFQRLDLDGTVWVQFRGGNQGQTEWQECMRKAAQEQAAQQRVAAPASRPAATTVSATTAAVDQTNRAPSPDWSSWISGKEYQAAFDIKLREGFYPARVEGAQTSEGIRFRAAFEGIPAGAYFYSYFGLAEDRFAKRNAELASVGFHLI